MILTHLVNESHKVVWLSQKINAVRLKHTKHVMVGSTILMVMKIISFWGHYLVMVGLRVAMNDYNAMTTMKTCAWIFPFSVTTQWVEGRTEWRGRRTSRKEHILKI